MLKVKHRLNLDMNIFQSGPEKKSGLMSDLVSVKRVNRSAWEHMVSIGQSLP